MQSRRQALLIWLLMFDRRDLRQFLIGLLQRHISIKMCWAAVRILKPLFPYMSKLLH